MEDNSGTQSKKKMPRFSKDNLDPRIRNKMEEFAKILGPLDGEDGAADSPKKTEAMSAPALPADMDPRDMMVMTVKGLEHISRGIIPSMFGVAGVEQAKKCEIEGESEEFIPRLTEHESKLRVEIFRPVAHPSKKPRPCLVSIHGGGMAMLNLDDNRPYYRFLCKMGFTVVAPDFRNSTEAAFPAGLHDCLATVKWADSKRVELNASCLIVAGESGGGNLATAVCLLAKKRGEKPNLIDGQYLNCPFLNNQRNNFPSLAKSKAMSPDVSDDAAEAIQNAFFNLYTPTEESQKDPLAWPIYADTKTLKGLPPALLIINELDGLRDEGEAYYRNLLKAGVSAQCFTVLGTGHGHCLATGVMPDIAESTVCLVKCFAKRLAEQRAKQ